MKPSRRIDKETGKPVIVAAVSGGPDSVFLLTQLIRRKEQEIVIGHVNHGVRGSASERDQKLVEKIAKTHRLKIGIHKDKPAGIRPGFEEDARRTRHEFLKRLSRESGGKNIAMGHTADDQVETVLMRIFEGAGIAGLKGIPRETADGIVRPILDVWKEDILKYLKEYKIPFRVDRSNRDIRFERNWIRHIVIPLLVKRYGKAVKKRIFTLGERFRELDEYLESESRRWIRKNWKYPGSNAFRREGYARLPAVLRIKVLQKVCFECMKASPNERLLETMDKTICAGGPSNRVKIGKGWELANLYGESRIAQTLPAGRRPADALRIESTGKMTPARAKRIAAKGNAEVFDANGLRLPLSVRPLRHGDRIRPFGMDAEKKVKEILIDRKIPREERWGRAAICDPEGTILWIPGVVRSAHAPVTPGTKCVKIVNYFV